MSTRCQVICTDGSADDIWFYRHSDGYPAGVAPTLDRFCQLLKDRKIRANTEQGAGWLLLIGREELLSIKPTNADWKVGTYEPCAPEQHDDIDHLYEVDMMNATWEEIPL